MNIKSLSTLSLVISMFCFTVKAQTNEVSYFTRIAALGTKHKVLLAQEFLVEATNFYKNGKNWLAINPNEHKEAGTSTTFEFETGNYDIVFVGVGENDGRSNFKLLCNQVEIGSYQPPISSNPFEEGKDFNAMWENIEFKKNDIITVIAKVGTYGKEYSRARWAGIIFTPIGQGKKIQ